MTQTRLVSATPQCPRCKSYLFMFRERDGFYYRKCTDCGCHRPLTKKFRWYCRAIKLYLERFWFWK